MTSTLNDDLLHGVQAIADFVGLPLRKTYYLIGTGGIPVHRLGSRTIVGRKSEIDRALRALPERDDSRKGGRA